MTLAENVRSGRAAQRKLTRVARERDELELRGDDFAEKLSVAQAELKSVRDERSDDIEELTPEFQQKLDAASVELDAARGAVAEAAARRVSADGRARAATSAAEWQKLELASGTARVGALRTAVHKHKERSADLVAKLRANKNTVDMARRNAAKLRRELLSAQSAEYNARAALINDAALMTSSQNRLR